ncbi:MAG: hypothetical protein ABI910_02125 [Gemmatimonadota bacterium]
MATSAPPREPPTADIDASDEIGMESSFLQNNIVQTATSATMFMGDILRWLIDRKRSSGQREGPEADSGPGVLFSSGLIAGGAITGVVLAALAARRLDGAFNLQQAVGALGEQPLFALAIYLVLIALPLYLVARRQLT